MQNESCSLRAHFFWIVGVLFRLVLKHFDIIGSQSTLFIELNNSLFKPFPEIGMKRC